MALQLTHMQGDGKLILVYKKNKDWFVFEIFDGHYMFICNWIFYN